MINKLRDILHKESHSVIVMVILVLIIALGMLVAEYYDLGYFFSSPELIHDYIDGFGIIAPIIFIILQIIQVIISPIPGNVTTLAGGALFGFWNAFWMSCVAVFIGSIIAFLLAKIFGRKLVVWMVGEERVQKYVDIFAGKQRHMLIVMFLLPFFPDDMLCLIAGITPMKLTYFAILLILTRPWGLLFSALLGAGMLQLSPIIWVIMGVIIVGIMILSIRYGHRIELKLIRIFKKEEK